MINIIQWNNINLNIIINKFLIESPLEQFEILYIYNIYSNFSSFLILSFLLLLSIFSFKNQSKLWLSKKEPIIFNLIELLNSKLIYLTIQNLNKKVVRLYYGWLFLSFFSLILINIIGIVPYAFTVTSHITTTFLISLLLFLGINLRAIFNQKWNIFKLFLPKGTPNIIKPILVLIELISYIARLFSLAIRLFANIIAGHALLKILITSCFFILYKLLINNIFFYLVGIIPFLLVYIITFLEVAIAFLQGYIFTVLCCLYIKDLHSESH